MYYIGIDVGGMSIKAGIVNKKGELLKKMSMPTLPDRHYSEIVKDMAVMVNKLLIEQKIEVSDIIGVGIGIPGTINSGNGIITYSNNINFENVPIVSEFNKYINVPTFINNDANCAALGEVYFGSGKGYKDAVFITLGTGVGSGIIIDGKIFEGKMGAGAEAGHMVIKVGGELCTCGRRGCWETYASATALIRQTKKSMQANLDSIMHELSQKEGKISGRTAFNAAKLGDRAGKNVINRYIKYISEGLVNVVNIFRPDVIMIGGGISNEGEYLIKLLQKQVDKFSYGGFRNPYVKIVRAELLNDAGILGAAALAIK